MASLAFIEYLISILIKFGIPGVKKLMEIWDVDKPTLEQIRALKDMPKPEEFFS